MQKEFSKTYYMLRMFDSPIIKPGDPIPKPHMTSVPMPMRDFRVSPTNNIVGNLTQNSD